MAYTDLLFDICQQFGIHYYMATKKSVGKKTMPTALWHNIHAIYNEDVAAIDFMTGDVIEGQLPPKALAMVREWLELHKDTLQEIWETQEFKKIPPSE